MKTLILGPLNYVDARKDLQLFNFNQQAYSVYFVLEGLIMYEIKHKRTLENQTAIAMLLASKMTDEEYNNFDVFYGLAPKKYQFDQVIVYNYDLLEIQEAGIEDHYRAFPDEFYTTADATDVYNNIMEAIKNVEFKPAEGYR